MGNTPFCDHCNEPVLWWKEDYLKHQDLTDGKYVHSCHYEEWLKDNPRH